MREGKGEGDSKRVKALISLLTRREKSTHEVIGGTFACGRRRKTCGGEVRVHLSRYHPADEINP